MAVGRLPRAIGQRGLKFANIRNVLQKRSAAISAASEVS